MKWISFSEHRSTALAAASAALALSTFTSEPATNGLDHVRLPPEPAHKGAELLMHPAGPSQHTAASGALPDDRMGAQTGYRSPPPLVKPTPRYGFGDRGQSYDPVLGRPPGMILFSVSY